MRRTALLALALLPAAAGAQQPQIPIRQVGPAESVSKDTVGFLYGVRELPGARLLVDDAGNRRLLLFDSTLSSFSVLADSTSGAMNQYGPRPTGIIRYLGDSTLFVDVASQAFLVIDPAGKVARVMSPPRPQDVAFLGNPAFGVPGFDAQGRLIYRGVLRPQFRRPEPGKPFMPPDPADSAPIVRSDFDTRAADTLAWIKVPKVKLTGGALPNGGMAFRTMINPVSVIDDWTLLPDGSLAIVRGRDYHIDWFGPDGTKSTTPKMPFDWKRLTDEDKSAIIDSTRKAYDRMVATGSAGGGTVLGGGGGAATPPPAAGGTAMTMTIIRGGDDGPPTRNGPGSSQGIAGMPQVEVVPASDLPDYMPPIRPNQGNVKSDPEGNIWILPTTSVQAGNGLLYDIVDRKGEIVQRVRLPAGRALAGFGAGGVLYLTARDATGSHLERARIRL